MQLELKRIHRELGATVVFVTHDQEEALVMSDRIAVFNAGRIQQVGTAEELYDAPETQFVAQFLGESNCWVGEVSPTNNPLCTVAGACGEIAGQRTPRTPTSGLAAAIVRPERCHVVARTAATEGWNSVPGRLREVVYLGSQRKMIVDLEIGGSAVVTCTPDVVLPSEAAVCVRVPHLRDPHRSRKLRSIRLTMQKTLIHVLKKRFFKNSPRLALPEERVMMTTRFLQSASLSLAVALALATRPRRRMRFPT